MRVKGAGPYYRIICAFVVLLPLEALLDPNNVFYIDWLNHGWLTSYYSHYIRSHWVLPDVVHARQTIGLVHTVFYGHVFYSVSGFIGAFVGPDLGLRAVIFAVVTGQFVLVLRLFRAYTKNEGFAIAMATFVTWTLYAVTNLYSRGAITEFVAVCLYNMSVCALLMVPILAAAARARAVLASSFFFTLAAATHPITAVLGGLVLCLLFVVLLISVNERGRLVLTGLAGAIPALVVISPWLYALGQHSAGLRAYKVWPKLVTVEFDTVLARIAPFPYDPRPFIRDVEVATPYLDAQINLPMLIVIVGLCLAAWSYSSTEVGSRPLDTSFPRFTALLALVGIPLFFYAGITSLGYFPALVPSLITRAQYAYRLTTYVNIALVWLALAAALRLGPRTFGTRFMVVVMTAAVSVSFTSVVEKLVRAHVSRGSVGPWQTGAERVTLPWSFYGHSDYNAGLHLQPSPKTGKPFAAAFEIHDADDDFATVQPLALHVDDETLVQTNVSAFPWNHVIVDGADATRYGEAASEFTGIALTPGDHVLEYRFVPDRIWVWLRHIGSVALALWAIGWLAFAARAGVASEPGDLVLAARGDGTV